MLSIENQILPPAILGMVTLVVEPGGPRVIAQLAARGAPVDEGESG